MSYERRHSPTRLCRFRLCDRNDHAKTGGHKEALADLNRCVQEMDPNVEFALLKRGALLIKMGDSEQGMPRFASSNRSIHAEGRPGGRALGP
jgi:hypothetical protein